MNMSEKDKKDFKLGYIALCRKFPATMAVFQNWLENDIEPTDTLDSILECGTPQILFALTMELMQGSQETIGEFFMKYRQIEMDARKEEEVKLPSSIESKLSELLNK